jgi:hypothetical protein
MKIPIMIVAPPSTRQVSKLRPGAAFRLRSTVGALVLTLAACTADRPAPEPALDEAPADPAQPGQTIADRDFDAEIHQFLPSGPSGLPEVHGMLHNRSNRRFSNVVIELTVLNAAGDSIGSSEVRARNLDPDGVFMFASPVFVEGGATVEIAAVRGY